MAEPDGVERDSSTGRDGPWTARDSSSTDQGGSVPDPDRLSVPDPDRLSAGRDGALRAARWGAVAAVLAALVTGIFSLWAAMIDGAGKPSARAGAGAPASVSPATSAGAGLPSPGSPTGDGDAPGIRLGRPVHIHPAGVAALCLTQGHTRDDTYPSEVAVQVPCEQMPLPIVTIEPAGRGAFHIVWREGEGGTPGCLDVIGRDPGYPKAGDLLQPVDACDGATLFTVRTVESSGPGRRYRFVSDEGGRCLGVEDVTSDGAEASLRRCADEPGQTFTVNAA